MVRPTKEDELRELSNAKSLKACTNTTIRERLRKLSELLWDIAVLDADGEPAVNSKTVLQILKNNGFAAEILRPTYTGPDQDQATQILAANVIVGVCQVTAPGFLFVGKQKSLIQFLLRQFVHLEKVENTSETYRLCLQMLDGVVRTGLFTFLAEPEVKADNLLEEVFDTCVNKLTKRTNEDIMLRSKVEDLLKGIFDEIEQVPATLLDIYLAPLSTQKSGEGSSPAARILVRNVTRRLNQSMLNAICEHLTTKLEQAEKPLMGNQDDKSSAKYKKTSTERIKKMRKVLNIMMNVGDGHASLNATLLPKIAHRLGQEDEALRRLVTIAMCRVFEMHTTYYTEYEVLFQQTLKQFHDPEKEIRLFMTDWFPSFIERHREALMTGQGGKEGKLNVVVAERLLDPLVDHDVSVRIAAVQAVTKIVGLKDGPGLLPHALLEKAFMRMRDKRPTVRTAAITDFGKLFYKMMETEERVRAPFNQIPLHMLEAYSCKQAKPEQRTELEKAIFRFLLPEDDEEDDTQGESSEVGKLAFAMMKMWLSLPPESKGLFAKLMTSKKYLREVAHVLPSVVLKIKKHFLEDRKIRESGDDPEVVSERLREKRKDPERVKLETVFYKVISQLNSSCRLSEDSGLHQLTRVPGQKILKDVVGQLSDIFQTPENSMAIKKKLISQLTKSLKQIDDDDVKEKLKRLPASMDMLLTRLCFPVSTSLLRSVGRHAREKYEASDGKNAVDLAHLYAVLAESFPEMFLRSTESVVDLIDLAMMISEDEVANKSWGGEADESEPLAPRGDSSPSKGKKRKTISVAQRRLALSHALRALKVLAKYNNVMPPAAAELTSAPSVPSLIDCLTKQNMTKLQKSLKKLALSTTEGIAKVAIQSLDALLGNDRQGKAEVFKKLIEDGAKLLDSKHPNTYLAVSVLRVMQQAILLHPHPTKALLTPAFKFATTLLPQLAKENIPFTKWHSFEKPPIPCVVFRMCLKYVTTYITIAHRIATDDVAKETQQIYKKYLFGTLHLIEQGNFSKNIQNMDVIKAILRLGRHTGPREVVFGNRSPEGAKTWVTIMVLTIHDTRAECRAEIGRVLHRDLMQMKLWLGFAQLLILTLCDSNKANYALANQRVGDVVATYRDKCLKNRIQLDSPHAPAFCPEYILPQLIHLLARFPQLEDFGPSYEQIQYILHAFFEKLAERRQCVSFLFDMILRLKKMDDRHEPDSTDTRLIADIAFLVLKRVTETKQVGQGSYPGTIHIPFLFTEASSEHAEWDTKVYINVKDFVVIQPKDGGNRAAANYDDAPGSTKRSPKKSSSSPKKRKSDGEGSPPAKKAKTAAKPATKTATKPATKPSPKESKKRAATTPASNASKRQKKNTPK